MFIYMFYYTVYETYVRVPWAPSGAKWKIFGRSAALEVASRRSAAAMSAGRV